MIDLTESRILAYQANLIDAKEDIEEVIEKFFALNSILHD